MRSSTAVDRRPDPQLIAPGASPEETAAIVAALETAWRARPARVNVPEAASRWLRAALLEGVDRSWPCE
jgi:hypothetical protein